MRHHHIIAIAVMFSLFLILNSCKKLDEYFREPDTESVKDVIKTSVFIGYTAELAMSAVSGHAPSNVSTFRSGSSFPCVAVVFIYPDGRFPVPFAKNANSEISVFGFWPDENTALITILVSELNIRTSTFTLHDVHSVPVIKSDSSISVVYAAIDINFGQNDRDELMKFDYSTGELNVELGRFNIIPSDDLNVLVEENAWFVNINQNNTEGYPSDDSYSITGGGQLVEASESTAGAFQQALLGVRINYDCLRNPLEGFSLIQKVAVEGEKFPETGTAILSFHDACNGKAYVELATGMYITSIGRHVSFEME